MRRRARVGAALLLASALLGGCYASHRAVGAPDAGADAGPDAGVRPIDAGPRPDAGPPPPRCVAPPDAGRFEGQAFGHPIDFPFVVMGVEPPGAHSCPQLWILAGEDPEFRGDHLEIHVPYFPTPEPSPGPADGTVVYLIDGEVFDEGLRVDVERADGLFERGGDPSTWRVRATVSHHDATTDLDGEVLDAPYCPAFPMCL